MGRFKAAVYPRPDPQMELMVASFVDFLSVLLTFQTNGFDSFEGARKKGDESTPSVMKRVKSALVDLASISLCVSILTSRRTR